VFVAYFKAVVWQYSLLINENLENIH